MKLEIKQTCNLVFYHKDTLQELKVEDVTTNIYEEGTEEFDNLIKIVENDLGIKRSENERTFEKKMMEYIVDELKRGTKLTIENIIEVFRNSFKDGYEGYITIGEHTINPKMFCCMKLGKYNIECRRV